MLVALRARELAVPLPVEGLELDLLCLVVRFSLVWAFAAPDCVKRAIPSPRLRNFLPELPVLGGEGTSSPVLI